MCVHVVCARYVCAVCALCVRAVCVHVVRARYVCVRYVFVRYVCVYAMCARCACTLCVRAGTPTKHSAGVNNDDARCRACCVRQLQYNYTAMGAILRPIIIWAG